MLHDAEDVVHPLELKIFDRLIDRAAVIQLPVLPLVDPHSRWISGHYCDEFAEAHVKELVVREAVGAAIPLAGVGCAIARKPLAPLAAMQDGQPFAGSSMTEDYEVGLRIGALGLKTMFVRIPARPGERGVVASRGHFPATLGAAVRQKARWLGGIALAGWDRLGWRGGLGERWMRMRDRRGPLAALLLLAAYGAALLWSQMWLAEALGAPIQARLDPALVTLLTINGWLLAWRVLMRACFTASAYGVAPGPAVDPAAGRRQRHRHARRGARGFAAPRRRRQALGQDPPHLPGRAAAMRPRSASSRWPSLAGPGFARRRSASFPAPICSGSSAARPSRRRRSSRPQFPPIEPIAPPRRLAHAAYAAAALRARRTIRAWPSAPIVVPVYYAAAVRRRAAGAARPPDAARRRPARARAAILFADPAARRMAAVAHRRRLDAAAALAASSSRRRASRRRSRNAARPPAAQHLGAAARPPGRAARTDLARQRRNAGRKPGRRPADLQFHSPDRRELCAPARDVGRRGGEVAGGVRVQPVRGIPVWVTAERRQALGRYGGGRNAFALFLEGGVYQRPMPWRFSLDAYLQGGVVGLSSRDRFIDGGVTLTRPLYRPILRRVRACGAAPSRASTGSMPAHASPMQVRNNFTRPCRLATAARRQCAARFGPALTLAGDF